jgi:hypothetical protein
MNNFLRNHYGFILGFITGASFLIFAIEVYKAHRNSLVYLGCWGLAIGANMIYRKQKKEDLNSSKAENVKKESTISAA